MTVKGDILKVSVRHAGSGVLLDTATVEASGQYIHVLVSDNPDIVPPADVTDCETMNIGKVDDV